MKKAFIERKQLKVLLHILVWSTFLLVQILFFQVSQLSKPDFIDGFEPSRFYLRFSFQSLIMIFLYYLNASYLIPNFLYKKRVWKYILGLLIALLLIYIIDILYNSYFEFRVKFFGRRPPVILFISLFIIALSTSIKLLQKWFENESQRKLIINEKINSELQLLKSQVNPHFLFNTLNGIYSLANSNSEKTAPAIVKLSQLMRYMLDESKREFVPLINELDYINTYIELQKLRLFDNVKVNLNIYGDSKNINIQPLLLIPFIENAFKHGTSSSKNCEINVEISVKEDLLLLRVDNEIFNNVKQNINSGFGLQNIKRRLELEYPNKHILTTEIKENKFIADLSITLR